MNITLNGKSCEKFKAPLAVSALLEELGFAGQPVLVELDGEPVPQRKFGETTITDGATIELIRIAAGG